MKKKASLTVVLPVEDAFDIARLFGETSQNAEIRVEPVLGLVVVSLLIKESIGIEEVEAMMAKHGMKVPKR